MRFSASIQIYAPILSLFAETERMRQHRFSEPQSYCCTFRLARSCRKVMVVQPAIES